MATKTRFTGSDLEARSNGREVAEEHGPYTAEVELEGVCPILFHRYDCGSVAEKGAAKKGSRGKKTDDVDSYVYRDDDGRIGIPGLALKGAIVESARFDQDPRSPRKSARDLLRAAVVVEPPVASLGKETWDALDARPVVVQRSRVTRVRPCCLAGWRATFRVQVLLPEYVSVAWLQTLIERAGKVLGLLDYRPDFGRFRVVRCDKLPQD